MAVASKARELIDDYESGGQGCQYDCMQAFGVLCVEGNCEADLQPDDAQAP